MTLLKEANEYVDLLLDDKDNKWQPFSQFEHDPDMSFTRWAVVLWIISWRRARGTVEIKDDGKNLWFRYKENSDEALRSRLSIHSPTSPAYKEIKATLAKRAIKRRWWKN